MTYRARRPTRRQVEQALALFEPKKREEKQMAEQCNAAGCTAPVLFQYTSGPRDGERWCFAHGPVREVLTHGVSRYEAFGRAAEPILREIRAMQQTRMVEAGNASAIRAALALLDGEAPHA